MIGESKIIEKILEFVVIEDARNACYFFDDLHEIVQEELWSKCNLIQTGSFAEGILIFNDIDKMHVADDLIVVGHEDEIPVDYSEGVLKLDTADCHSGFTRLELIRDVPGNGFDVYTTYNGKRYLDRSKFMAVKFTSMESTDVADAHGPAVMTTGDRLYPDIDLVECFKCFRWVGRRISFKERSADEKRNPMELGCHIVPVSHKASTTPELEFRFSFSICEKALIRRWTSRQMNIYYIIKSLFKKYFQEDGVLTRGLCSYFAKTVIFWLDEMHSNEFWESNALLNLIRHVFDVLKENLSEKKMPNYFIVEYNMIDTFTNCQITMLLMRLDKVSKNLFSSILACDLSVPGESLELLKSLYGVCKKIEDDGDAKQILQDVLLSISQEDFMKENNDVLVPIGGRKAWNYYKMVHCYALEFSSFFTYNFNISLALHRSDNIQRIRKRLIEATDSAMLQQTADIILNRGLAFFALSALFSIDEKTRIKQTVLLKDAESLFASSIHFPLKIQDGGIAGSVCLGLFYYLTGRSEESYSILLPTSHTALLQIKRGLWPFLQQPLRIFTEKNRPLNSPRFFAKEEALCGLYEQLHIHFLVEFDPLVLCSYLMCKIDGNFELFDYACCSRFKLKTRTGKESSYLRLKLRACSRDEDGGIEQEESQCTTCDYVDKIQDTKPLNIFKKLP